MKVERAGSVLRVTLDSPDRRNVLTAGDCEALRAAVHDESASVVLLQAEGQFFCAGAEPGLPADLFDRWTGIPVVAAVQGPALDEGVALMACAHVVVAAQGTSFALTSIRKGEFPQGSYRVLARAIGERRALELALTGRAFTVQDALQWGLVHHVAPAFEFDDRAEAIAAGLAARRTWLQDALS